MIEQDDTCGDLEPSGQMTAGVEPAPEATLAVTPEIPEVGRRVTLTYPPDMCEGNFPTKRVGVVKQVYDDGSFEVSVQPQGHLIKVVPREYASAGATWRAWNIKDGWPLNKPLPDKKKR